MVGKMENERRKLDGRRRSSIHHCPRPGSLRNTNPRWLFAHLSVYNLLGEKVATLVDENLPAGNHIVEWDATGQPSGVYFYRLQAGDFVETRKLVLLR